MEKGISQTATKKLEACSHLYDTDIVCGANTYFQHIKRDVILREMRAEGDDPDAVGGYDQEGQAKRLKLRKECDGRIDARFGTAAAALLSNPLQMGSIPAATAAYLRSHEMITVKPKPPTAKQQKLIDQGLATPPSTTAWQSKASLTKFKTLMSDLSTLREVEPDMRAVVFTRHDRVQERLVALIASNIKAGGALATPKGHKQLKVFEFNKHTAPTKRHKLIRDFQDKEGVGARVFIVTYATAAVGITLTAANRVYLMEPCIDPGVEAQAAGRIHRLGQTKEIFIKRYCFRATIEEAIIALHAQIKNGTIKIVDGHMPHTANKIMADACTAHVQHDLQGPVHDLECHGCEEPIQADSRIFQSQGVGWKDTYRKENTWRRVYKIQECVVCGAARDVKGTSRWSGTGIYEYLNGNTRDPATSHDTPTDYTHFLPGGHGRFARMPRPPNGWFGLHEYTLDNGEAEPEGGFGDAPLPDLEPLKRAIARAFVTRAQKNTSNPPPPIPAYLGNNSTYMRREQMGSKKDAAELALEMQTIRSLVTDQLTDKKVKGLNAVLVMYLQAALEQVCEEDDSNNLGRPGQAVLWKLKKEVADKVKRDKSCVIS